MGWAGDIFLVVGLWFVGNKKRNAFIATLIGESIWTVYALMRGMYDLAIICAIFAFIALRNWINWGKISDE